MFDFHSDIRGFDDPRQSTATQRTLRIASSKRLFDIAGALLLLAPLTGFVLTLCCLNPFLNQGPLWFVQKRMGYRCRPFMAVKFRSMTAAAGGDRGAFDRLETDRITALGQFLRKTRIDELPQIINVLRGEMSLIGPRPDSYDHAQVYLETVPGYRQRHQILPGISGYAQTEIGYVDGLDGLRRKVRADLYYAAHATLRFDLWITWRTLLVVFLRRGA